MYLRNHYMPGYFKAHQRQKIHEEVYKGPN